MEEAAISQEAVEPQQTQENENVVQNEGQEAAQEVENEVKPEPPKEEPIPKGVQKRIDRAVRQKYEAEARANELERRLREIEQHSRQPQTQQKLAGEPKIDQFENIEDYVSAKAAFVADQRIQQTLTARERAEAEQRAQAAQQQTADTWNKRVQLATAELPDFEDVISSSDIRFNEPSVLQAIQESDIGPKIAYYLASNHDEADDIAQLRGSAAIRAIGRIEAKLELGKANITKTPPPIEPAGTKAKAVKSPAEMNATEFARWRKGFIASRGSR